MSKKSAVKDFARAIQSDMGLKYTDALRTAENEILLGGVSGFRIGGPHSKDTQDILPLLRTIKPFKINVDGEVKEVFVTPQTVPGEVGDGRFGVGSLGAVYQEGDHVTEIVYLGFTGKDDEDPKDFQKTGALGFPSEPTIVAHRVVLHDDSELVEYGSGPKEASFAYFSFCIGKYADKTVSLDLRGLSYGERITFISETLDTFNTEVLPGESTI